MSYTIYHKSQALMGYLIALFMLGVPSLFRLSHLAIEGIVLYSAAGACLVNSFVTRNEAGFIKLLPIKLHQLLYVLIGLFLAISPWLLGFSHRIFIPHLVLGLGSIVHGLKGRFEFESKKVKEWRY